MPAVLPIHRFITVAALLFATQVIVTGPTLAQATRTDVAIAASHKVERNFFLDYKDKRLTFHEDGKPNLFAKTVTTPTVLVRVETGTIRSGCKVTLRDGLGKVLWSEPLVLKNRDGKNIRGSLNFTADTNGGVKIFMSANNADVDDGEQEFASGVLAAVVRSDNKLQTGEYVSDGTRIRMALLKNNTGLVFTQFKDGKWEEVAHASYDQKKQSLHGVVSGEKFAISGVGNNSKTVHAVLNGKEIATATTTNKGLMMSDGTNTVEVKAITQDGKKYTEVLMGGQRLLIQEGSFNLTNKDGVYILTPANPPVSPVPAKETL